MNISEKDSNLSRRIAVLQAKEEAYKEGYKEGKKALWIIVSDVLEEHLPEGMSAMLDEIEKRMEKI